jgi:heme/copper-type cytochrome/quinol oxidase subunit 1
MQRRIAVYPANAGWSFLNMLSSIGSFILAFAIIPFLVDVWVTLRHGKKVGPNPWDGMTLEWATSSPPPEHNFEFIPPIRSERPVWDLNHPEHPTLPHGRRAKELQRAHGPGGARAGDGGGGDGASGDGHGRADSGVPPGREYQGGDGGGRT